MNMPVDQTKLESVSVPASKTGVPAPVKTINGAALTLLANTLKAEFTTFCGNRTELEQRWLRNMRQYLGKYDPEIETQLSGARSKAYPRITRVKCISILARLMNLMFPGNERNWELKASPSADMDPADVMEAINKLRQDNEQAGRQSNMPDEEIEAAVQQLANERAELLATMIDDQLQELGGDQTLDYIALNRKIIASGILYGLGVLRGPFVTTTKGTKWVMGEDGQPTTQTVTKYKPMYEFVPVWDFYPDLSAKSLMAQGTGYFIRLVMTRSQLRALAKRSDFIKAQIDQTIKIHPDGNYKAASYEADLRSMSSRSTNTDGEGKITGKYEIICWHGPLSGQVLKDVGVEVPDDQITDDVEAEVWMVGDYVIKAEMNAWRKAGVDMRMIHTFSFDEDDTSLIGNGMPAVMRDSQMAIAAAARMLLDNAGVVCGPNIEVNVDQMMSGQDVTSVHAYKVWLREGDGANAQYPAVRNVQIDAHMDELLKVIELFMRFADAETFVGPQTGGDMERGPSEPMRTAAGASMLRADAALPFKDIVRHFDTFTQSLIQSMVSFNRTFNRGKATQGDYNVIARGATSLVAKEVRGMQADMLAQTLRPEEMMHVDERKLVEARLATRDMTDVLVPKITAMQRIAQKSQMDQEQMQLQRTVVEAEVRKMLSDAFKNIAQGQKNSAAADAAAVQTVLKMLEAGLDQEKTGADLAKLEAETRHLNAQPAGGPKPGAAAASK